MEKTKTKKLDTTKLRKFAQFARTTLMEQVEIRLNTVLAESSLARRESEKAVEELEKEIKRLAGDDGEKAGKERVIEKAAYIWFNRFCALRYMDVNRYTKIGVISPADGQFQPEILAEAKMGHMDDGMIPKETREKVNRLLDETDPSDDPQGEAYRLLLVAACNHYHSLMPTMFQKIADWTELLLPDDLLSGNSIPAYTRESLLPINCSPEHTDESVEVIGWLYQFYISEKKDDVFAALKKGKKITPENIPAATQLFTPHWIVRYLVENSLGRLWMLNHPDSRLIEQMDYYIRPEEPETDFLRISSPEEIKICDPACGSGHMLTYAFDLLYAIYEEQGYQATDIPRLILTHNLYGIEIDQRAGALAAFALTMKAREKYRRFLTGGKVVQPNICVLENISIDPEDLSAYMDKVGRDLFSGGLQGVVNQWEEADNFGSLIRPLVTDVSEVLELLRERQMGEDLFLAGVHQKVLKALRQADYLSPKYHVVVANPPYMGSKGMNGDLAKWARKEFAESKGDLFAMFIVRASSLLAKRGLCGMITMHSWMFLSTFEDLRDYALTNLTITSMAHLGARAFDSIGGEVVSTTAFIIENECQLDLPGDYFRLVDVANENEKSQMLTTALRASDCDWRYRATSKQFRSIPGSPIAYWASVTQRSAFERGTLLGEIASPKQGIATANNDRFLRRWQEVAFEKIHIGLANIDEALEQNAKWLPYNKGGEFRKWYGNNEFVINWENDGAEIRGFCDDNGKQRSAIRNPDFYFRPCATWTDISSSTFGVRQSARGFLFDGSSHSAFPPERELDFITGLLCSATSFEFLKIINPTMHFQVGNVASVPVIESTAEELKPQISSIAQQQIACVKRDWDSFETSWDFATSPLTSEGDETTLDERYQQLRSEWRKVIENVREYDEQNNALFIRSYGMEDELSADVPLEQVTLDWNPHYRYGSDKSESELEALLLADTMREFISYAVGCMLGRYSLDQPGLILANQGETADDYRQQIPEPTFAPDEDNVIPLLDGDWFEDDITERFKAFLKVTFGTEHYEENLTFLENSLFPANSEGKKRKTIRDYFLKEFYNHHIKLYKKRPIYWLFSSPKGTFNALIYMHRYRPDTVSVVLNDYLREFIAKMTAQIEAEQRLADNAEATTAQRNAADKKVIKLKKALKELEDYEREILRPLADKQIEIDLDDGVKKNYNLFGKALKKVTGLTGKK